MNRTAVNSSALVSVGYDPARQVLELEITGGAVYQYFDVPEPVFRGLMSAESLGKYYNAHIKNEYRYVQVSPGD